MSKETAQQQIKPLLFLGGSTFGLIGILLANFYDLWALLWISFAVSTLSFIGLTVSVVHHTTRHLNKLSRRD